MKVWIQSKSGDHNKAYDYPMLKTLGAVLYHILKRGFYYSDKGAVPATEIEYIRKATEEEYPSS